MTSVYEDIKRLRDASIVRRSHTLRILRERTVAEHSHGICITLIRLYQAYGKMPSANLLAAACCHDLSEVATGDIPANAKWENPPLKMVANTISRNYEEKHGLRFELTEEEKRNLAWADPLDFGLYALEEITSGNRYLVVPAGRIYFRMAGLQLGAVGEGGSGAFDITNRLCDEIRTNIGIDAFEKVKKENGSK